MTTRELVWNAMFAADMSHRYFISRAAWNKRADDTVRVLLLVMSSAAWATLVARVPAPAPYLAFAAVVLASLTVIVRFHDQASTYAVNGRRKVTYSRQPSVRSSPASDLFLVIDGEEDAGCGRCGKPRSSRFSKLPVGALFASMGSVGVHGPGVGRQRCVRVA